MGSEPDTHFRTYGTKPFQVVLLHGGPGAPGTMGPVAKELSSQWDVLEPFQNADSIEGLISELKALLLEKGDLPIYLMGHSWGAMLGYIFAARHPNMVKKLIIVGSGVFEEKYSSTIMKTRLSRLNQEERTRIKMLMAQMNDPNVQEKDEILREFGEMFTKADAHDPLTLDIGLKECHHDQHVKVWAEAKALRLSGDLLKMGRKISCPVVAIHGSHDPHPMEGIRDPLDRVVGNFKFIELDRCGHAPWIEKHARDAFFRILERELSDQA